MPSFFARRRRAKRFEALLSPCLDGLHRFACQLAGDPVSGEDLLQQSLATAYDRLDQLREDAAFRAWVGRILYRSWQNQRGRRAEVLLLPVELERRGLPGVGPDETLGDRRLGDRLDRALAGLPPGQREAVWLVDGLGLKFSEAAEVLDLQPGTVASRVARGRAALRVELAELARERGVIS
ncbi:MAG: sigma-70 family RNA polymerase sigma factor [Alphaproteobacteria bacterium]|nr:sigma-70 family RNA polymerase sigma factor [Alphaproteobacteria bacterium]MCB9792891.1 sigma-70 family RNA polymerase sigma factor [Alphaproteobacteria bacterium]